ncbi:E3 ubiquitin-protein ligase HUWE1 isoform X2 [Nematostella vectensis]|uniref:E3 ubiquitin-protein ligase HUWE1 isoform X2 n=1 Tax=Nematostella vectensis TaxID=45351 RepID=UPI00207721C4|nr:E3 ubiquitin-protein ligase HUWE1 isoform X2 [Nematostella vectensis]
MKIERSKIRKSHSQPAPECQHLIQRLTEASEGEMVHVLKSVHTWYYGKCDLGHWADVLDRFDDILTSVAKPVNGSAWILTYDKLDELEGPELAADKRELVNQVLRFTALLIEHAYSRPTYNSAEHLICLLVASDMEVVLSVLGLLYVFSKRCSFIPRLPAEKRKPLQQRLLHIGESWGGVNGGFSLAECCRNKPLQEFPASAGDVHFEFYTPGEDTQPSDQASDTESQVCSISVEKLFQFSENAGEVMEQLLAYYKVPTEKQVGLFARVRLAKHFPNYTERLRCVQARLWAISVLVYSNVSQDIQKSLMYQGFVEEVVDLLKIEDSSLLEIKTAGIRLLTSVIHLQYNPRLNTIVECAGIASYHGFLPSLMRTCIQTLTDPAKKPFPMSFSTALFSFVYHLACFEIGSDALVSSGLIESLLRVIEFPGTEEHLTFVTRAVRIMDWIGNTANVSGYQNGLTAVINRLEHEVKVCKPYHSGILPPDLPSTADNTSHMETTDEASSPHDPARSVPMETEQAGPSSADHDAKMEVDDSTLVPGTSTPAQEVSQQRCLPQRAALIKALLSFLKKVIPDPAFSESIRNVMDGSLPTSLKYIISNVEYYGPVLFLGATDVVTVYVFHEPSLLSSLQDNGLTGVVMKSLVVKDIPAMREVLSSLPSVLSALCLNTRGLQAFMACKPFDKLFKVMLSPEYLPAMRRKKATEELGETASNLGIAMDELMRHQPTLMTDTMKAIVKIMEQLCNMGYDPKNIGYKITDDEQEGALEVQSAQVQAANLLSQPSEDPMTDDEYDDDDRFSFTSATSSKASADAESGKDRDVIKNAGEEKREFIPLADYILNVVKFVDAILSNNSTDDHCQEFVRHKGLLPLLSIFGLPNLPLDFPSTPSCQAVSSVCKSLLMLAHEPQVLKQGQLFLKNSLNKLQSSVYCPTENTDLSICHEVVSAAKPAQAMHSPQQTPLLHAVTAVHAYVSMFLYVSRAGQMDLRTMCVNHWGSQMGVSILKQLGELHMSLQWEMTVLETLVKEENDFANNSNDAAPESSVKGLVSVVSDSKQVPGASKKAEEPPLQPSQQRIIKQLLQLITNVNKCLSEFFSLLLRLSVGTAHRQRRTPHSMVTPGMPSANARHVTAELCKVLHSALSWQGAAADKSSPELRLHFYVSTIKFASKLLFDDKKFPYHLMLQQFMMSGALDSLFEQFTWVLTQGGKVPLQGAVNHPDMPEGTEETLDAWLVLIDKLANPKALLESPHSLPAVSNSDGFVQFKPVQFLIRVQKRAFMCVGYLWGQKPMKVHGSHMAETMLSILCNIFQGESMINEKLGTTKESTSNALPIATPAAAIPAVAAAAAMPAAATPAAPVPAPSAPPQPEINEQHLQQLMDMGFTREHARDAILNTNSLEQATEYILAHPHPSAAPAHPPPVEVPVQAPEPDFGDDFEMSEEDQMMRAIALSLGQDISPMIVDQPPPPPQKEPLKEPKELTEDEEPLAKDLIDHFTINIFAGCRNLLEEIPDTVYQICKLIATVSKRNGAQWRDMVLKFILVQIEIDVKAVISTCSLENSRNKFDEMMSQMCNMQEAGRLSSLLHLLCLMFEEMKLSCAVIVEEFGILSALLELLDMCQGTLMHQVLIPAEPTTPKWLCPLLLLLDLYEKTALSSKRKKLHDKCTTHVWRWFDDRSGRWYAYSPTNNEAIDAAYRKGETKTRFLAGRRHYSVNFSTMVQINEDSGSRRPVMLETVYESSLSNKFIGNDKPSNSSSAQKSSDVATAQQGTQKANADTATSNGKPVAGTSKEEGKEVDDRTVESMDDVQKTTIIRCCTMLVRVPVNNNALHAALRLCLRITQEHKYATQFVNLGGPKAIMGLTQKSSFPGFLSITTLLLHHVLEDTVNFQHTVDKVIRSVAVNGVSSSSTGVSPNSVGAKEINYVLRVLGPAATRDPELFKEAAKKVLRYAITPQLRRALVEGSDVYLPSNHPHLVKVVTLPKPVKLPVLCEAVREVVCDLLNALCAPDAATRLGGFPGGLCVRRSDSQMLGELGRALGQLGDMIDRFSTNTMQTLSPGHPSYGRQITGEDTTVDNEEMAMDSQQDEAHEGASDKPKDKTPQEATEKEKKEKKDKEAATKPLLTKSAILRILAELVKTYGGVAQLITEYTYSPPSLPGDKQYEGPVLAYIFDHLLSSNQDGNNSDTPAFARLLLAVIAMCNQAPEAQQILVTELKASLTRALALPEKPGKHVRLQALFSLIQTMIDSGARTPQQAVVQPPNTTMRLLTKRGLITDLARVPHSLDLASPYLVTTLNALLKPLEKLSSIVTQSQSTSSGTQTKPATQSTGVGTRDVDATDGSSQTQPEGTSGEGDQQQEQQQQSSQESGQADLQSVIQEDAHHEDTQDSGEGREVTENLTWDLGVTGHAIVPVEEEDDAALEEALEDVMDEILQRNEQRPNGAEGDVVAEEVVSRHHLDGDLVEETHYIIEGNDDDESSSSDSEDDGDDDEGSEGDAEGNHHSDSDNEETMVITFEADGGHPDEQDDNQHQDEVDGGHDDDEDDDDDDARHRPHMDESQGDVVVMDEEADDDDDDDEDDDDDDEDGGSLMEEETADMMQDDAFAVYEDDNVFLQIRDVQDDDSSDLMGDQLQRNLPIGRHHGAAEVLQLNSGGHESRLLLASEARVMARQAAGEDGMFLDGYMENTSSIPSALSRWTEESQILDPDSVHYCVAALKPELFPVFEKHLSEEIDKEKKEEQKKKKAAEAKAAASKKEEDEKKAEASKAGSSQQPAEDMQVDQAASSSSQAQERTPTDSRENMNSSLPSTAALSSTEAATPDVAESALQTSTPRGDDTQASTAEVAQNIVSSAVAQAISNTSSSSFEPAGAEGTSAASLGSPMTLGSEVSQGSSEMSTSPQQSMTTSEHGDQENTDRQEQPATAIDQDVQPSSSTSTEPQPGSSGENNSLTIDGIPIPEGVDPSFLEALPEALRREVLSEQLGLRPPPSSGSAATSADGGVVSQDPLNVSPEFLAALPPDVQEEVLQQQRLEEERRRAQQSQPDTPVDPGAFLRNLPPSLRQSILADIDDSQLNVLPTELASEAQTLRRETEVRRQRMIQDRFAFGGDTASAISALLRHSGLSRRSGGGGLHFTRLFPSGTNSRGFSNSPAMLKANQKYGGKQLLDHEALACLVVLLFIDEPRLNIGRLQKVFRNLCYHEDTRRWLINTLILVLKRTDSIRIDNARALPAATQGESSSAMTTGNTAQDYLSRGDGTCRLEEYLSGKGESSTDIKKAHIPSWLKVRLDSSLGTRTNVFSIQRQGKVGLEQSAMITVHPHASAFVCRHALDSLLFLAKTFSSSFIPSTSAAKEEADSKYSKEKTSKANGSKSDFWSILLKLDSVGTGRKGKSTAVSLPSSTFDEKRPSDFSSTPIGELLTLLAHPVIKSNVQLTDRLLRLLSVVASSLPEAPAAKKTAPTDGSTAPLAGSEGSAAPQVVVPEPAPPAVPLVVEPPSSQEQGVLTSVLTIPISETDSVASSLAVERSSEPGGHEVESIDSGSGDEVGSQPPHGEPMVVDVAIIEEPSQAHATQSGSLLSTQTVASSAEKDATEKEKVQTIVSDNHLQLAVTVLTGGSCSEDGLEDATTLLLQISRLSTSTRNTVLAHLLEGAQRLGETLRRVISVLLLELIEQNKTSTPKTLESDKGKKPTIVLPEPPRRHHRPAHSLFGVQDGAPAHPGGRRQAGARPVVYELHLPSMPLLTCKKSSQALLLRVLKVILQLREAAKKAGKPQSARDTRARLQRTQRAIPHIEGSRGLGAVVAALEAEAEAIFEVFSLMRGHRHDRDHGDRDHDDRDVERAAPPQALAAARETVEAGVTRAAEENKEQESKESEPQAQPVAVLPVLSEQLALDDLWDILGESLTELAKTSDSHAVLLLQPAVEAFFLVHGSERQEQAAATASTAQQDQQRASLRLSTSSDLFPASPGPLSPGMMSPNRQTSTTSIMSDLPTDTQKFLKFAETHRTVLNQILRQSTVHLSNGPFAVLVDHTRVLDFDVKRRFFRQELEQSDEGIRREDLTIPIRRDHVFEDSYRELHRRSAEEWKARLYIVFEGEEGQDAGGLLREWFIIMSREMFNPNYALFTTSPGDRVTYQPNASSHCNSNHLSYFKFVGRVVAKAVYDNKLLECYFTRSFYKHILGKPVHFTDLESFDYSFYQGLQYLLEHDISELGMDLTFSTEVREFGLSEIRDLIPNGRNIPVTEENKREYVKLVCQMKMTGAIRKQIDSFLEGFYEIIPKRLISIFNEQELELLISGLPNIDLDDLKSHTEYHKYNENSLQIQWFWRALRSFDQAARAKFLQFVTGTSKVPLQGFAALEGMNGFQKFQIHRDDRNTDRLPSAHTCFNQLDLPAYETYDKLRTMLKKACDECPEGFGLA